MLPYTGLSKAGATVYRLRHDCTRAIGSRYRHSPTGIEADYSTHPRKQNSFSAPEASLRTLPMALACHRESPAPRGSRVILGILLARQFPRLQQ